MRTLVITYKTCVEIDFDFADGELTDEEITAIEDAAVDNLDLDFNQLDSHGVCWSPEPAPKVEPFIRPTSEQLFFINGHYWATNGHIICRSDYCEFSTFMDWFDVNGSPAKTEKIVGVINEFRESMPVHPGVFDGRFFKPFSDLHCYGISELSPGFVPDSNGNLLAVIMPLMRESTTVELKRFAE